MKAWYSKVRDTELIDGSVRADYVVTFETDNFELKRKVEKYLQGIMDEAEQTEPQTDYKKWDAPPKVDLPTGEITTCVSVLAAAFEEASAAAESYRQAKAKIEPQTEE